MLKKKNRLPKNCLLRKPLIFHSPFLKLKVSKNGLLVNRYGIIVSKKVDKRAVVRNKIKRKIKACLLSLDSKLIQGNDFLFLAKNNLGESLTKINAEIERLFEKGKFLR